MVTATIPHETLKDTTEIPENGLVAPKAAAGDNDGLMHKISELNMTEDKDGHFITGLHVNNSMSGGKALFVPAKGNIVNWYGCGPTVYDSSHMGHARNYVTFDILRRIMEDYFGYNVNMVMNVTDIDDKIIARANELKIPFDALARYWENDFWRNMQALNCRMPDSITRVSEYIPEIISFIEGIIGNGYAYESNGSVYFDTTAFRSGKVKTGDITESHVYGRMEPWSVNDEARVLEGEGTLGAGQSSEKNCPLDFALWKKSKEGEPSWDSPWGEGRPGWHIECSAMAANVLGFPIDIHSGGIDLRFPHHDNELAQSEAHYDRCRWVNYFLHSGHLHIQGLKMSKSLKNFIRIETILESYDVKIVRLLVLMHRWDQPMNYHPRGESMVEPTEVNRVITNFFATMKTMLRKSAKLDETWTSPADVDMATVGEGASSLMGTQKWHDETERALFDKIVACQVKVHGALSDNFDTPSAMAAIQQLISEVNVYISKVALPKGPLLIKATAYVHKIMKVFGLVNSDNIFGYLGEESAGANNGKFEVVMDTLAAFRHQVREGSRALMKKSATVEDAKEMAKRLLTLCDEIRDVELPAAGVRLEDQGEKGYVWKEMR